MSSSTKRPAIELSPDDDDRMRLDISFEHHKMLAAQIAELSLLHEKDDKRMTLIESELRVNTAATQRIDKATSGMVSMFGTLESGVKVIGWIGIAGEKLLKAGALVGGGYALWLGFKAWVLGEVKS